MDLEDFSDFIDLSRRIRDQGPRRYLRDYSDPFYKYTPQEFFSRYRFTPNTVRNFLVSLLKSHLKKSSKRGLSFAPEIMILATLRYYATGSFQKLGGDVFNICQQSMSRIVYTVSLVLAKHMKNVVKFPSTSEDFTHIKTEFYEISSFPGVVGCLNCTHIKIKSPGGLTAEVYRNRKGWFSLNVQAVTGPDLKFYDLVVRWPGSYHDSFIHNSSSLKQRLNSGELQGTLLGDSGYGVSPLLMTPHILPCNPTQERYNRSHIRTRNLIERAFGIWKRRFPCLQVGMGTKLKTTVAVVYACAVLHNYAILYNDVAEFVNEETAYETNQNELVTDNPQSDGFLAREAIALRLFS